jgi:hypothetical protein
MASKDCGRITVGSYFEDEVTTESVSDRVHILAISILVIKLRLGRYRSRY